MKRGNNKAQGVIEFLIIFAALLFFFIVFFSIIQINIERKNLDKEKIIIQNTALDVQYEISLAAESSEGYIREFKTPINILGKDYEINIVTNRIYVAIDKMGFSYKVQNLTGTIKKGSNTIKKQNGEIYLN